MNNNNDEELEKLKLASAEDNVDVENGLNASNIPEIRPPVQFVETDASFEDVNPIPPPRTRATTFSPNSPENAPVILTWKDLTVKTKTVPPKILLNNISGVITGGFWAIMGASGGGKTTLLSTVSLRLDINKIDVTGSIHLNGREYSKGVLKAMSAYVLQDDLLHAELTVRETISYAAELRLAGKMSLEDRLARQEDVIRLMGIGHIQDVIIGDSRRKGISGGERKRVCVAIELLTEPKLIFLDEPTSGLDSATALSVCEALKNLSDQGLCTVICTIHQPQRRIFDLFDNLILMKKGQIVYQGACRKSLLFLECAGKPCPSNVNPADFLIEAIATSTAEGADDDLSVKLSDAFDENAKKIVPVDLMTGVDKGEYHSRVATIESWFSQFTILFQRSFQQYYRRTDIILLNLITTVIVAVFISCGIWYQIGTTQTSIATRVPSLFFACVTQGIVAALQTISSFPTERAIILRERAAGAYDVSAYFLAKTVTDLLSQSWAPTLFCAIVYPTIGYQNTADKFLCYWILLLLCNWSALSLATCVSCVCVSLEMSTVILSLLLELSRLYGGFFTSPQQLLSFPQWKFVDALSYLKYAFVGIAVNELSGLTLSCSDNEVKSGSCIRTGEAIMAARGYDQYTVSFCAGILVVYIIGMRILAYLALRYIKV